MHSVDCNHRTNPIWATGEKHDISISVMLSLWIFFCQDLLRFTFQSLLSFWSQLSHLLAYCLLLQCLHFPSGINKINCISSYSIWHASGIRSPVGATGPQLTGNVSVHAFQLYKDISRFVFQPFVRHFYIQDLCAPQCVPLSLHSITQDTHTQWYILLQPLHAFSLNLNHVPFKRVRVFCFFASWCTAMKQAKQTLYKG